MKVSVKLDSPNEEGWVLVDLIYSILQEGSKRGHCGDFLLEVEDCYGALVEQRTKEDEILHDPENNSWCG